MDPNIKSAPKTEKLEGKYANYFKVGHNAFEFVIDFGQYYPETDEAELYTRVITNPPYAKALLKILQDSIDSLRNHSQKVIHYVGKIINRIKLVIGFLCFSSGGATIPI